MRNEIKGSVAGTVVQAGSVEQVWLTGVARGGPVVVPRQLPLAVPDFTGRTEYVATLDALLPGDEAVTAGAVAVAVVDGVAGIGKTALVVRWSYRVQDRFPDGTLFTDLRGYGPGEPVAAGDVLAGFLGALGLSANRIPADVSARSALYRSMLAGRRVLVVLDNAGSAEQVRPLLPGGGGCVVVVTSRTRLRGLRVGTGARRLTLDPLTEAEAVGLVRAILVSRADAEPAVLGELVRACGCLPLAVQVAAGRVATEAHLTVADVVGELSSEPERWEALSLPGDEASAVRGVFNWSYRRLTEQQARMFRLLGLHPAPEISLHAAAAIAGLAVLDARRVLDVLVDGHLVEPIARDRYRFHDLLHAFAAQCASRDESPAGREQACRRVVAWYTHHAVAACRMIAPEIFEWYGRAGADVPGHPETVFSGSAQAWEWAERELDNACGVVRLAARHGLSHIGDLAPVISISLGYRGWWDEAFEVCRLSLECARRLGDRAAEFYALSGLGYTHHGVGEWRRAEDAVRAALGLARELGNPWWQTLALSQLGGILVEDGRYRDAEQYLRSALSLSHGVLDGRLGSFIEWGLSGVQIGLGDYGEAFRHAARGLALVPPEGHWDVEVNLLHSMARARQGDNAHSEALELCERALNGDPQQHDPLQRALILDTLGSSLRQTGRDKDATDSWREALAILDVFGDRRAADLRERLHDLEHGRFSTRPDSSA